MSSWLFRPRLLALGALALAVPAAIAAAVPGGPARAASPANAFVQTNLISNRTDQGAKVVDADLQNPWGLAFGPTTPLWSANNNKGNATLYSIAAGGKTAGKVGLTVGVPGGRASTSDGSSPTGQVFNPTSDFVVSSKSGKGAALFLFSSESGQITAWNPTADPISGGNSAAQLEYSSRTAVYKGLAIGSTKAGNFLYASNFHDGTVDVFNSAFKRVHLRGQFRDVFMPRNYAPFGIQEINGLLYVTYAQQNAQKHDDVAASATASSMSTPTTGSWCTASRPAARWTARGA